MSWAVRVGPWGGRGGSRGRSITHGHSCICALVHVRGACTHTVPLHRAAPRLPPKRRTGSARFRGCIPATMQNPACKTDAFGCLSAECAQPRRQGPSWALHSSSTASEVLGSWSVEPFCQRRLNGRKGLCLAAAQQWSPYLEAKRHNRTPLLAHYPHRRLNGGPSSGPIDDPAAEPLTPSKPTPS